jgi:hypothetical protein
MYRTIVAGSNGRERGRGAVSLARAIASATGARPLLVVGSRHRPRLQRMVEGDQALEVLHGAPCAVAIARDPLLANLAVGAL